MLTQQLRAENMQRMQVMQSAPIHSPMFSLLMDKTPTAAACPYARIETLQCGLVLDVANWALLHGSTAQLHSCNQLWPFFEAELLLRRLREPAIQKAMSLMQLFRVLLPDTSDEDLQEIEKM